ncbi:MAG: PilN domain-containing protein [bacterium]|nr:PilN domain-containing protein [bacterium]
MAWAGCRRPEAPAIESGSSIGSESGRASQAVGSREPREIAEQISGFLPEQVALDRVDLTPHHVVLRGHARDLDGVADLLERLGQMRDVEEPVLRRALRSERGYEYTVVVPALPPAITSASIKSDGVAEPPPPFAASEVAAFLFRQLNPPFT